jgi:hypothetical protein
MTEIRYKAQTMAKHSKRFKVALYLNFGLFKLKIKVNVK